jgi:hypothetical protein
MAPTFKVNSDCRLKQRILIFHLVIKGLNLANSVTGIIWKNLPGSGIFLWTAPGTEKTV